jgi:GH24 family phage-related lysozyme (muramidase)
MKKEYSAITSIIILGIVIIIAMGIVAVSKHDEVSEDEEEIAIQIHNTDSILYEYALAFNKSCEDYIPCRYLCPAGVTTIGYGHVIIPGDTMTWLTIDQADSLLRMDIDIRLSIVQDMYPDLDYNKQLALANFLFSYGPKGLESVKDDINNVLDYKYYRSIDTATKETIINNSELLLIRSKFIFDMYNEHWFQ